MKNQWIKNIREARILPDGGADKGNAQGGLCNTCGIRLTHGWDTICAGCGNISCYHHSHAIAGHWYCPTCAKSNLPGHYEGSEMDRWSQEAFRKLCGLIPPPRPTFWTRLKSALQNLIRF